MNKLIVGVIGLGLMVTSYCDFSGARGYATKTMSVGKSTYSGTNSLQVSGNAGITGGVSVNGTLTANKIVAGSGGIQSSGQIKTSGTNQSLAISGNTVEWFVQQIDADGSLRFYKNAPAPQGEYMRILNGGNVGIGTTAPSAKLEVNGTVSASALVVNGHVAIQDAFAGGQIKKIVAGKNIAHGVTTDIVVVNIATSDSGIIEMSYKAGAIPAGSNAVDYRKIILPYIRLNTGVLSVGTQVIVASSNMSAGGGSAITQLITSISSGTLNLGISNVNSQAAQSYIVAEVVVYSQKETSVIAQ